MSPNLTGGPLKKRFVSGETLPYLGRNVVMVIEPTDDKRPHVTFDHWRFRIAAPDSLTDDDRLESIRAATVEWYRNRASERLPELVRRWWPRLGRGEMSAVLIRESETTLGKLCAGRHIAVQLAHDDAETDAH